MENGEDRFSGQRRGSVRGWLPCCGFALLAMVCGGCGQVAQAPAASDPVGTYALVSVDGNKVPCALTHGDVKLTVRLGAFTIKADGTCISKMTIGLPSGEVVTKDVKATYTREGAKLTMKWEGAGTTTGTVQAKTFTMINEGAAYVYQK